MGELEIKVVSLEKNQDFLSKRYEEEDRNIEEIKIPTPGYEKGTIYFGIKSIY